MTSRVDRSRTADSRRRAARNCLGLVAAAVLAWITLGPPDAAAAQDKGYLAGHEVDFHTILGPPPAPGSRWDHVDQELVEAYQDVDEARFESARLDEEQLYSRFEKAFGHPVSSEATPKLVALLDRALLDVDATAAAAKQQYQRPRPYQRMKLHRVCNKGDAPVPEEHPMHGASYPSGHSVHGWTVAMILSRIAPDRAQALMDRAEEYEESRLVCGMHFPTDIEAGQVVAAAVVSRLDTSAQFRADLAKARKEYASH